MLIKEKDKGADLPYWFVFLVRFLVTAKIANPSITATNGSTTKGDSSGMDGVEVGD